jgi:hypothetical protein
MVLIVIHHLHQMFLMLRHLPKYLLQQQKTKIVLVLMISE